MAFSNTSRPAALFLASALLLAAGAGAQEVAAPMLLASVSGGSAYAAGLDGGPHAPAPQGYLGIAFHDVTDPEVSTLHLKDRHGAEILMVDHDGPAGKAGLREHDVILSMNGTSIEGEDHLRRMLHDMPPGKNVSLYICREGAERTVTATLASREELDREARQRWAAPVADDPPPDAEQASAPPSRGLARSFISGHLLSLTPVYTGASVDDMGTQLADYFGVRDGKGLLVHAVETNSPAAAAGLHAGDVITRMNNTRVATERDWNRMLHDYKGKPISLTVVRDRHEQTLTMTPDSHKRSSVETPVDLPTMMLR